MWCMNCKDFLNDTITHLSGERPGIVVNEDEHGAVITLNVRGRVSSIIGKNGSTIDAIRTLAKAIGLNGKHRIKVRIYEQA